LEALIDWRIVTPADTCPSCGHPRPDRYCGRCGERATAPDELTFSSFIRSLGEEFLPFLESQDEQPLTRIGGRVYRTVYTLLRWPGRLTADYAAGRRRPYLKPIQVYLLITLIFFLFGHNFFQYGLGEYEYVPFFGETAQAVSDAAAARDLSLEEYRALFDERVETHKKGMIALVVPFFALGLLPLYRRQPFGKHLIFAIHYFAIVLLFMLLLVRVIALLLRGLVSLLPSATAWVQGLVDSELLLVLLIYVPMWLYLWRSLRVVYGGTSWGSGLKALALVLWHMFLIVMVFRNGLFFSAYFSLEWFK
jgi:hypothetical protein